MDRFSTEEAQNFDDILNAFRNKDFSRTEEFFNILDRNKNGTIDASEMKVMLRHMIGDLASDEEAAEAIKTLDRNNNGVVELNELIEHIKEKF